MAKVGCRALLASCDLALISLADEMLYRAGYELVGASDSAPAALYMVEDLEPDVVLISAFLREEDGLWLLGRVRGLPLTNMPAAVFIAPFKNQGLIDQAAAAGACLALDFPPLPAELVKAIAHVRPMDRLSPAFANADRAREILDGLSLSRELKGYEYLVTAVMIACRSNTFFRAMTTVVYPETAKAHNATAAQVERCIRHAIDSAWIKGDMERQYAYFGNTIDSNRGKPTNSEFIARVTEALRLEAM